MKLTKKLMFGCVIGSLLILAACDQQAAPADTKMAAATDQAMLQSFDAVGMPGIKNWTEKRLMREIYELRDQENLATFTYLKNEMTGRLVYLGRSIGYGLPASVQYSNPSKIFKSQWGNLTVPLPEPNGLFMPEGLSATWVIMIDPVKKAGRPVYMEDEIHVSPFPLPNAVYPEGLSYDDVLAGKGN